MITEPVEKLLIRVRKISLNSLGISLGVIGQMTVDSKLETDLKDCLTSSNPSEIEWGLFFCEGLFLAKKMPEKSFELLVELIPTLQFSPFDEVRAASVNLLIMTRSNYTAYKNWMLDHLQDQFMGVRKYAVSNTTTFLDKFQIKPLLGFQCDPYITETNMNGPFIYALRNIALEQIEQLIEIKFERYECSELHSDGFLVYWRSWQPLMNWLKTTNRKC